MRGSRNRLPQMAAALVAHPGLRGVQHLQGQAAQTASHRAVSQASEESVLTGELAVAR